MYEKKIVQSLCPRKKILHTSGLQKKIHAPKIFHPPSGFLEWSVPHMFGDFSLLRRQKISSPLNRLLRLPAYPAMYAGYSFYVNLNAVKISN